MPYNRRVDRSLSGSLPVSGHRQQMCIRDRCRVDIRVPLMPAVETPNPPSCGLFLSCSPQLGRLLHFFVTYGKARLLKTSMLATVIIVIQCKLYRFIHSQKLYSFILKDTVCKLEVLKHFCP